MNVHRKVIVTPGVVLREQRALFSLLAAAYPVVFSDEPVEQAAPHDGVIAWHPGALLLRQLEARGGDALAICVGTAQTRPGEEVRVEFGRGSTLERCFREARMHDRGLRDYRPRAPAPQEEIVCRVEDRPVWFSRSLSHGELSLAGFDPPPVAAGDTFYTHCNRFDWLRLLPFARYLSRLTRAADWQPPPLRACLMFDDPNLHWRTYGFIDYAALAAHAERHGYHAAIAMVPADVWFTHAPTAALFRANPRRLSLLMHGNDHDGAELLRPTSTENRERLLAQALRRIAGFEEGTGVPVARVMAPPHGAFDLASSALLRRLGYEALCVSRASLTASNRDAAWPPAFGHGIVEWLDGGLPVLPRQGFGLDHADAYRLAAFLHQPIIPHGHHGDCADGLDRLADLARLIDSLGEVEWCDLRAICASNRRLRHVGDTLCAEMLSSRVTLPRVRPDVHQLVVVRPWLDQPAPQEERLLCSQSGVLLHAGLDTHLSREIPLHPGEPVELCSQPVALLDPADVAAPSLHVWPAVRRILTESRDRAAPFLPRLHQSDA